jgi:two-component system capsular synthesis response regulator RcsB
LKCKNLKVAIADDHPLVICGLVKALEKESIEVAATASNAPELLAALGEHKCDVVVTDYSMPHHNRLDGWRFLTALSSRHPDVPLLVYSEFDDPFLIGSLAQRGIEGLVSKRDEMSQVVTAIRRLAAGERYMSPVAHTSLCQFSSVPELRRFAGLSRRQMEVAGLMLCGLSVGETARLLDRSANTISTQRTQACKRLGFAGEFDMYRFAASHNLWLERSGSIPVTGW